MNIVRKILYDTIVIDVLNQTEASIFVRQVALELISDANVEEFWNNAPATSKPEIVNNFIAVQNAALERVNIILSNVQNDNIRWWLTEHCLGSCLQYAIKIVHKEKNLNSASTFYKGLSTEYVDNLSKDIYALCDLINIICIELVWILGFSDREERKSLYKIISKNLHGGENSIVQWCLRTKY